MALLGPDENEKARLTDWRRLPASVDPEWRTEQFDETWPNEPLDLTAFVGMPDEYRDLVSKYVTAVCDEIGTAPLMRKRYYHRPRTESPNRTSRRFPFPDDPNPIYDRDVVVPLVVFPRPEIVKTWTATSEARSAGWRHVDSVFSNPGTAYGETVLFEPGLRSQEPCATPPSSLGYQLPQPNFFCNQLFNSYSLQLQKVVLGPLYRVGKDGVSNCLDELHPGEEGGAILTGELTAVPVNLSNRRLRWVSCRQPSGHRTFLAYALIDGNGARRAKWHQDLGAGPISPYIRPLVCARRQPRIKQHDLLLLPTPIAWPPFRWSSTDTIHNYEEWSFDDWFPAQDEACWVIREAATSKPLMESFELMPASQASDLPIFFAAVFAETAPERLVRELAALYSVSADTALKSPEAMQRLMRVYQRVRDYPWSH